MSKRRRSNNDNVDSFESEFFTTASSQPLKKNGTRNDHSSYHHKQASHISYTDQNPKHSILMKPPPPPSPPQSLVHLIRSDSLVLKYFTSLQANLDYDVQKWKNEASKYKKEAKYLRKSLLSKNYGTLTSEPIKLTGKSEGDSIQPMDSAKGDDSPSEILQAKNKVLGERQITNSETVSAMAFRNGKDPLQPISDDFFNEIMSLSSSTGDKSSGDDDSLRSTSMTEMTLQTGANMDRDQYICADVLEAYWCLKQLAVVLAVPRTDDMQEGFSSNTAEKHNERLAASDEHVVESGSSGDEGGLLSGLLPNSNVAVAFKDDSYCETHKSKIQSSDFPSMIRRSDIQVCSDLFRSIRSFIRFPSQRAYYCQSPNIRPFPPFSPVSMLPCFYDCPENAGTTKHPAIVGLRLACRAITLLDVLSPIISNKDNWDRIVMNTITFDPDNKSKEGYEYPSKNDTAVMRFGLRDRNISDLVLTSLEGELCQYWTTSDKALRADTQSSASDSVLSCHGSSGDDFDENACVSGKPERETLHSSNKGRLFQLVERIAFARIISSVYQHRRNFQKNAWVVLNYIIRSSPDCKFENNTSHLPCVSMCILEAFLIDGETTPIVSVEATLSISKHSTWFGSFLKRFGNEITLTETLALVIHSTASVLKRHQRSSDEKVRQLCAVELAAYERLLIREKWLMDAPSLDPNYCNDVSCMIVRILDLLNHEGGLNDCSIVAHSTALVLALIMFGDLGRISDILEVYISVHNVDPTSNRTKNSNKIASLVILSCCKAYASIQNRDFESGPGFQSFLSDRFANKESPRLLMMKYINDELCDGKEPNWDLCIALIRSSVLLCDGMLRNHVLEYTRKHVCKWLQDSPKQSSTFISCVQELLRIGKQHPTVRVINLERRSDRLNAFIVQARREGLIMMLAGAPLNTALTKGSVETNYSLWGLYAIDGYGSYLEFEKNVATKLAPSHKLASYVSSHWRPSDLKAFDKYAGADDGSVRMSPSERACALSHISSWIGVERSIAASTEMQPKESVLHNCIKELQCNIACLYRVSGFASGQSVLPENSNMPPSPVCVILEDDAVLVDRFSDRLDVLLRELPRDFHFCSLGYGRPVNAPIVKFAEEIGIPTCIWYLTGYILSLEGARFLLQSLPVQGPVDSWIGLKMAMNWDNTYGSKLRIGINTKAIVNELPAKKYLPKILRFRCFAALVPLCSQKLLTSTDLKWRGRDSDVTYSGKTNYS